MDEQKKLDDALKHVREYLPPGVHVSDVFGRPYVDSDGDEACKVWVVLDSTVTPEEITAASSGIQTAVNTVIQQFGIHRFPYLYVVKETELDDQVGA